MAPDPIPRSPRDDERLLAAVEVIGRAGATELEIGYLHDDVPADEADWWASARWRGTRIMTEHHIGPCDAAEELAARVIHGGVCIRCGGVIRLAGLPGPLTFHACSWTREGSHWLRGCDHDWRPITHPTPLQTRRRQAVRDLGGR